ncbi:MAG TPA: BrnT family toxin [Anaerolineales bacterium]|nr:BrnT family toxin [Anaerolineales bacterium]HUM26577.1 BrnT family toxin [Anaerolineales bacterium]
MGMKIIFEWDENKARTNFEKHKVSFDEARTIFVDPLLVTFADELHSEKEERFISIGLSENNRILLVVHTEREEKKETIIIRIISCRKATPTERKRYEKGE